MQKASPFEQLSFDQVAIGDESSFAHVGIYAELKRVLRKAGLTFRVMPDSHRDRWDRTLLLNLTFWGVDGGGDILESAHLEADVVTHIAWHHLAARALSDAEGKLSAEAMFLGESIASAFDLYLVGRLLGHALESSFLETQVPAMRDTAEAAGMSADDFDNLLEDVAAHPERAFEDLRQLLFDATCALYRCSTAEQGFAALQRFDGHKYSWFLHRYELSNWVLYAQAYGTPQSNATTTHVLDASLRAASDSLQWLTSAWLSPVAM